MKLCRSNWQGIVHCTNSGDCTWFDFAQDIIRQAGLATTVKPTSSDKYVRPAERPKYSVLSAESLHRYGFRMRPWQQTLPDYLAERAELNVESASSSNLA